MKPECKFYNNIVKPTLDQMKGMEYDRIETVSRGIPDIAFTFAGRHGWIELKSLGDEYMKRTIHIPHHTGVQKLWLKTRGDMAGNCWVLLYVNRRIFLIPYRRVYDIEGKTFRGLEDVSSCHWENRIGILAFTEILTAANT